MKNCIPVSTGKISSRLWGVKFSITLFHTTAGEGSLEVASGLLLLLLDLPWLPIACPHRPCVLWSSLSLELDSLLHSTATNSQAFAVSLALWPLPRFFSVSGKCPFPFPLLTPTHSSQSAPQSSPWAAFPACRS